MAKINKPNNWDNVQTFSDRPKLPVGGYVCKILKAEIQNNNYGDQLLCYIDITDGDYTGFYGEEYKNNTADKKRWKGVLRLWLARDDGSEKDETTKSIFKGFITSVEHSNNGYAWNWDTDSLKNKAVGIIFRNEEWEFNGKSGWTVRPFKAVSVERIQDCDYKLPDDKPLKNKSSAASYESYDDADDELPF